MVKKLWEARPAIKITQTYINLKNLYQKILNKKFKNNYKNILNWSIKNSNIFWNTIWDFCNVKS